MSISIAINKKDGIYYVPGETIKGIVTADMDEPKTCDYLTITFEGKASVEIVESRSETKTDSSGKSHTEHHNEYYRAEEIYLSSTMTFLGASTLPRGRTVFPFEFSLPTEGLPCTFTASHGSVNYKILVHMKRPLFRFDIREAISFVIGPVLDLNRVPLADYGPYYNKHEKPVGGCCCFGGSETISLEVTIPKRMFIPGEIIRFKVVTENKSGTLLESGVMQLVLSITCAAQGRTRVDEMIFGQMAGPAVPPNRKEAWEVSNFMIPVLKPVGMPPSGLGGCHIIDARYILRYYATLDEGCCNARVEEIIPLMIGTIALNLK